MYGAELLRLASHGGERLATASASAHLANPLCGDEIDVDVSLVDGRLRAIGHAAQGCAVLRASAALLERVTDRPLSEARRRAVETLAAIAEGRFDGELAALAPLRLFPTRRRCASLPWVALAAALAEVAR